MQPLMLRRATSVTGSVVRAALDLVMMRRRGKDVHTVVSSEGEVPRASRGKSFQKLKNAFLVCVSHITWLSKGNCSRARTNIHATARPTPLDDKHSQCDSPLRRSAADELRTYQMPVDYSKFDNIGDSDDEKPQAGGGGGAYTEEERKQFQDAAARAQAPPASDNPRGEIERLKAERRAKRDAEPAAAAPAAPAAVDDSPAAPAVAAEVAKP